MSKALSKLEKQCATWRKQITEHKATCPQPKSWALEYECPKCKASKDIQCKSPSGHIVTNTHKERTALTAKDVAEANKVYSVWQTKCNKLSIELDSLLGKHRELEAKEKKALAIKKFKDSFKGVKLSKAELVLEVGRDNDFLVIKSHNIAQLVPGDRLPSRDVLPMLSKKGVDIIMTRQNSYYMDYGPSWYWQAPRW